MKKIIAAIIFAVCLLLPGCGEINRTSSDVWHYDRAIISLPNGEIIDGPVQWWRDYTQRDYIIVKVNGTVYLVSMTDVVLMSEGEK